MGKTYKRADGRWAQDLWIDGKRQTLYGRTRKEVQGKVDEARQAAKAGKRRTQPSETVQAFCDRWLRDVAKIKVRGRTHERYTYWLGLLYPSLGNTKIQSLQAKDVQATYAAMLAAGRAPKSLHVLHAIFKQALCWACDTDESLVRNPASGVVLPRLHHIERTTFSGDEFSALMDSATYDTYKALWGVLGFTGMRFGEACALRWGDWQGDWLHIERSVREEHGGGHVFGPPKTEKGRRVVYVVPQLAALLRWQKAEQNTRRLQNILWKDSDLLFTTSTGSPLWRGSVGQTWRNLLRENELPAIRIHDLRHTAATILANAGVRMEIISLILGHASVAITSGIYAHIAPTSTQEAMETLAEVLSRKERKG